jgi:phosphoenolpyruvate carboxykinase (ATP)
MFPKNVRDDSDRADAGWTLINVPSFVADPERDGTNSARGVIIDIEKRVGLVLGPADYCGVNKKTMFTIMNYVLPAKGQLSMHCSANVGSNGDSAILFGLSGTGKTTLSADPDRLLIGDDEHVWTDDGVSNFEDGCYAKLIDLDKDNEPVIAAALSMPGTLIENVPALPGKALAETHPQELDLFDGSRTENTRFAYPLACNPSVAEGAAGPHPQTIVLLTADAFGVLPPISMLTEEEVMYHFVMGFTSKLAGTEVGVTEPQATFSSCFGSPFMSQKPIVYAELLAQRMADNKARSILLNTGWTGGAYGTGERMSLKATRALLNSALAGELDDVETEIHPILGLAMPKSAPGVDTAILNPRNTWDDTAAYDLAATKLRDLFRSNYRDNGYGDLGIPDVM